PPPHTSPLSLHDALPISAGTDQADSRGLDPRDNRPVGVETEDAAVPEDERVHSRPFSLVAELGRCLFVRSGDVCAREAERNEAADRKSTRLNSSHLVISY